jgi:DNA-binding MurR/RpiR family transcriptional regulator
MMARAGKNMGIGGDRAALAKPPGTPAELHAAIRERYDSLPSVMREIGKFVLDSPGTFALETLTVIAKRCGAQPSAVVRFAKTFGFDGASAMQRLLKDDFLAGHPDASYGERARRFRSSDGRDGAPAPDEVLLEFAEAGSGALRHLASTVHPGDLSRAVDLIEDADTVWVAGFRRAFPVASYLAYSLHQTRKRTVLVDGVAGMAALEAMTMTKRDVLVAISFHPYAGETQEIWQIAGETGLHRVAITDSVVSPLARSASVSLIVRDAEVRHFRTLTATMCLAQSLAITLAFRTASRVPAKIAGSRKLRHDAKNARPR